MKVKKLADVLKEHPDFVHGWNPGKDGMHNEKFGFVEPIVVCKDDGVPIWGQYQIYEIHGSVIVSYYRQDEKIFIGLITIVRPVVKDPETGEQGNYKSLEVPRGFNLGEETTLGSAKRELGEETGRVLKQIYEVGQTNVNTAFCGTDGSENTTWVAEVDPHITEKLDPGADEKILKCEFFPLNEVMGMLRNKKIICGLTKSTLIDFVAHMQLLG